MKASNRTVPSEDAQPPREARRSRGGGRAQTSLNRREFFGTSARQAAEVAAGVLGWAGYVHAQPVERLRIAVVGLGTRGQTLLEALLRRHDVCISLLCDTDRRRFPSVASLFEGCGQQVPMMTTDLLACTEFPVEVVVIATPDRTHVPLAIEALHAGKHVYLETPATWHPSEGRLLYDSVLQSRCVLRVGLAERSSHCLRQAIECVHTGVLGEVAWARAWSVHRRKPIESLAARELCQPEKLPSAGEVTDPAHGRAWIWSWDHGGGELTYSGVNWLDVARWGLRLAWPERVAAVGGPSPLRPPTSLHVQFTAGEQSIFWEHRLGSSHGLEGRSAGVAFYGTTGTLVVDRSGWKVYDGPRLYAQTSAEQILQDHWDHFLQAIRAGDQAGAEVLSAIVSSAWCHLGNLAYRRGHELVFDSEQWRIVQDVEADAWWQGVGLV